MVDLGNLSLRAQLALDTAVAGWLRGRPTDEVALLNRLVEQLTIQRYCNVGVFSTDVASVEAFVLHRQGERQTDLFGADLAVTVNLREPRRRKTALFQLKKSVAQSVRLERGQLNQPVFWNQLSDRSWVVAVDEITGNAQIESVPHLLSEFGTNKSKGFSTEEWLGSLAWIRRWLECSIGLPTSDFVNTSVEWMLAEFVVGSRPRYDWLVDADNRIPLAEVFPELPPRFLPARTWLIVDVLPPAV